MGKFKMKGHSIPGIKGFKSTSKEDGRDASSAFQQTDDIIPPKPKPTLDAEVFKYEAIEPAKKEDISAGTYGGQGGFNFALQEIIKAKKRLNTSEAKEAREANKKVKEEEEAKEETERLKKEQYEDSEEVQVGLNLDE